MTEEEKQAETDTATEDKTEETKTDAETEEESEEEALHDDNKIDYEAELKREREAREKAEKALAEDRYKRSEEKRKKNDESEDEDEKPLTKRELAELLEKERYENRKILMVNQIESIAGRLATSDSEKNLLIEIHRNRSFPSHLSLDEQLEECYVIANKKKLIGERNEALRALKGKAGAETNPASTYRDTSMGTEPKIAPQDAQAFKDAGFSWNGKNRQWEKKLKNGGTIIRDSKTGQTRLIKPNNR